MFDDRNTRASARSADTFLDFKGKDADRIDLKLVDANDKARGEPPGMKWRASLSSFASWSAAKETQKP